MAESEYEGELTGGWTPSDLEKSIEVIPKNSFWAAVTSRAVEVGACWAGANAAAEPTRAARTVTFIMVDLYFNGKLEIVGWRLVTGTSP